MSDNEFDKNAIQRMSVEATFDDMVKLQTSLEHTRISFEKILQSFEKNKSSIEKFLDTLNDDTLEKYKSRIDVIFRYESEKLEQFYQNTFKDSQNTIFNGINKKLKYFKYGLIFSCVSIVVILMFILAIGIEYGNTIEAITQIVTNDYKR